MLRRIVVRVITPAAVVVGVLIAGMLPPGAAFAAGPRAVDDAYRVGTSEVLTVPAGEGMLANDLDVPDGAAIALTGNTAHGVLSPQRSGSFRYDPNTGFVGTDGFGYCITETTSDRCASASVAVTITVHSTIERIGGIDRYAVSAAVSASRFPAGLSTVYIASGEVFSDALSASAAAGTLFAPVLLVRKNEIPGAIAAELRRLMPDRIRVLGGPETISSAVFEELAGFGAREVYRREGANRYAVSAAVSSNAFPSDRPVVFVASGETFPDALAGSTAAGAGGAPVLLIRHDSIPDPIAEELTRLNPASIVMLGGRATLSETARGALERFAPVTRIDGADRYEVAAAAAAGVKAEVATVYIASGEVFPDALSGAAAAIADGAPILLVRRDGVPQVTTAALKRLRPAHIVVLGGSDTISDPVYAELAARLR